MQTLTREEIREGGLSVGNRICDTTFDDPEANEYLDEMARKFLCSEIDVDSTNVPLYLMGIEEWKRAPYHKVMVSNLGRVSRISHSEKNNRGNLIRTSVKGEAQPYLKVQVYNTKTRKRTWIKVHTLVWQTHGKGGKYKARSPVTNNCAIWNLRAYE